MTPKYTQLQFDNAKSRDLLELECEHCHDSYKIIKKRIKDTLKGRCKNNYCSAKCACQVSTKKINITCSFCKEEILKTPSEFEKSKNHFCSHKCSGQFHGNLKRKPKQIKVIKIPKPLNKCLNCGQLTKNNKFCSGTCRNKINNKNIKGSKSKAEIMLVEAIRLNFPQWGVIENDRKILDGLELDIFIPNIKLAIEWNGVFHYEPIRGLNSLEKIITKDNKKIELCKQLGIELIVICDRTSHIKFIKETINTLINNLKKMAHPVGIAPT